MKSKSEGQIRAYFLGRLAAAAAESFEEECAASEELTELAQAIEGELADDYLRGNLSAADAQLFESNYLVTEARRTKLHVAQGLRLISGEKPKSTGAASGVNAFWQKLFGSQKALKLAFGGLILFLIFGGLSFYVGTPNVNVNEVAEIDVGDRPLEIENPVIQVPETENQNPPAEPPDSAVQNKEANKNPNSLPKAQPGPKTVPAPKTNGQNQAGLAVFTLLPGTLRDEGEQSITVSANTKKLSLQLKLPENAARYQIFRVTLKPVEDETIHTVPSLRSPTFTIPAEKLENRTYIIFLEGRNAEKDFESITEYTVRVRR